MNITIVVDRYYPHIGGIEQYVRGLSKQLTRDGHQMTIITGPAPKSLERELAPEAAIIRTPVLADAVANPQLALDRHAELAPLIKSTSPDVVYANNHASLGSIRASQMAGIPVVYGCHGWGLMCPSRIRFLKHTGELCQSETSMSACMKCYASGPASWKIKLPGFAKQAARVRRYVEYHEILSSADARIGVSELAASMFREQEDTFAIHPGIDLDEYRPVDDAEFRTRFGIEGDYVLVPGRVNPIKGQMDALKAVHESSLDISLVIAGNVALDPEAKSDTGTYGRAIAEQARSLGIADRVIFTGMLSQPEMAQAYSGALATLVPSVWFEPFGYVAIESMACGTPVIITSNSGAAELVDDSVGQKVPRQDHVAMARALERVVPASGQLGYAARRRVEETVSWPRVSGRVVNVLQEVADGRAMSEMRMAAAA